MSLEPNLGHYLLALADRPKPKRLDILDRNFPKQFAFITDNAKLKAGFCTRRAGKSYGIGLNLLQTALDNPMTTCLYIALTRESAKRIMFKDVLYVINRRFNLQIKFNMSDLTATLPNGSVVYFIGMDSSEQEAEKALGQKLKLVVIDEAASFRRDLSEIVYKVLRPACTDLDGQIVLIGTPGNITRGLFYDVVHNKVPGWAIHKWGALDNPYIASQWQAEIDQLTKENPLVTETPWFKQMYLGLYVIDQTKLVYRFVYEKNIATSLPSHLTYVLGVDLGFDDPSAFVVCGYQDHDSTLYVQEVYKASKMIISDVAERIKYYVNKYKPFRIVIDNAAKQSVEELKQRFGLNLTPADKHGKPEFIEIMNSEMIGGKIKYSSACEELFDEYASLIWDDQATKRQEHPNCQNHLADACLYAWRSCYNYLHKPLEIKKVTDEEKIDIWFEQQSAKIADKSNKTWWEQEYDDVLGEIKG